MSIEYTWPEETATWVYVVIFAVFVALVIFSVLALEMDGASRIIEEETTPMSDISDPKLGEHSFPTAYDTELFDRVERFRNDFDGDR